TEPKPPSTSLQAPAVARRFIERLVRTNTSHSHFKAAWSEVALDEVLYAHEALYADTRRRRSLSAPPSHNPSAGLSGFLLPSTWR
ncbi:hypothetical protein, partial [Lentimonas sp. CC4]|uniref:hypothetical protein n=1 Tax=Lentimonas sp. CC4 TaxID=2676099 RepID=UPI001A7EB1AA